MSMERSRRARFTNVAPTAGEFTVIVLVAGLFFLVITPLVLQGVVAWVELEPVDELVGDAKAGYFESMAAQLPIGRIALPADIAPAYLYVMESDFTTGETIHIDGGQRLI